MSIAEELIKLEQMRDRGSLSSEEFARAKARLLDGAAPPAPGVAAINRFRRSRTDRWIGGVCGGIAAVTGLESWVWRLIFTLLLCFGGTGLLLYVLLWIFVPTD